MMKIWFRAMTMDAKFMRKIFCLKIVQATGLFLLLSAGLASAGVVGGNRIMDQSMDENLCALTFDDGPSIHTPLLLDMLADYDIPATFFLLGRNAARNADIVKRMVAEGHEIGNHSWTHPNLRYLGDAAQEAELVNTDRLLRSLGATPLYIRPPYGSFDARTVKIAEKMGVSVILWSLDSLDWKHLPADYSRLPSTRGTIYEQGDLHGIFLFHDTHKSTVEDLPRIIAHLKAGGCERFVTVNDYLAGILDPEPPLRMSRRNDINNQENRLTFAAGSGDVPMARCSRPSREENRNTLQLEDAHAAASMRQAAF